MAELRLSVRRWLAGLVASAVLFPAVAFGPPADPSQYLLVDGGIADIPPGSVLEGSHRQGGIQPDYVIDPDSAEFVDFLAGAKAAVQASDTGTTYGKVRVVRDYVNQIIKGKEYNNSRYLELLKTYSANGQDVPLSGYLKCSAGVCREHALLLHFALKAVGIENFHVYGYVEQAGFREDHAFVVVFADERYRVVDAYNANFDDVPLNDLLSEKGVMRRGVRCKIVKINSFPRIWIPLGEVGAFKQIALAKPNSCSTMRQKIAFLYRWLTGRR